MFHIRGKDKNQVVLQGNVARLPKLYERRSRGQEIRFTIVTEGIFVDIVFFQKQSVPDVVKSLAQGQKVHIKGRLMQRRRSMGGHHILTTQVELLHLRQGRVPETIHA